MRVGVERKLPGQEWCVVSSFEVTGADEWTLKEALDWAAGGPKVGVEMIVLVRFDLDSPGGTA